MADSLIHSKKFVLNFKIQSQVVSEKSMTEKKFTDRQKDRHANISTEKAKTIYPIFTSYTGGINIFTIYVLCKNKKKVPLFSSKNIIFIVLKSVVYCLVV